MGGFKVVADTDTLQLYQRAVVLDALKKKQTSFNNDEVKEEKRWERKKAKIKREVAARQRSFQLLYANDAIWTWVKDLKMIQLYEDLTPHKDYLPRQLKWKKKKKKQVVCL